MNSFREYFLSFFDRQIATGIIEFGKKLSNTKADIFILMARKAACFTECLEELSLTKLNGHVTTDRVLDMDLSWFKGKDVVIVDDAIVSGTTIYETINTLKKAGVNNIKVMVICVNKNWFTPDLLLDDHQQSYLQEPYLKLKNEECIKLCSDIVTSLSIFPRPYAVDFPLYTNIRIPEFIFDSALINSNWDCDEITSDIQKENAVVSLTITPRDFFLEKLDTALGFPISMTSMCKIRVYGMLFEKTRSTYSRNQRIISNASARNIYSLKILPIVVLKPIRTIEIDKIFDSITQHFTEFAEVLIKGFASPQSKLRLIQHIAAHYLGQAWIEQVSYLTQSKISLQQDSEALGFLYPPNLVSIIQHISGQSDPIFKNATYNPVEDNYNYKPEFDSKIFGIDLVSVNAKLTEPFINLYHTKELKSRQLVREFGKEVFKNSEYKSILARLKKGFSLTYLHKTVSAFSERYDTDKIVSLFLDKSVDMGIVVPITGEKDGVLFRAYRHGEDVIFGELEEKLCSVMLLNFSRSSAGNPIPHTWAEKLLVLLLKIGVQKKFLREFIYDNPPKEITRIVSVKNYLFGQVAKEQILEPTKMELEPVYLNEDQKSQWLSNILLEKHYLTKVGKKSLYKVEDIDTTDISSSVKLEAENIGDIFGMLYHNKEQPRLVQKDLVLLTSCLNPNDISASMAAEIFIFRNKWDKYKVFINREALNEGKFYEIIRSIRFENKFWVAVNSGQDKYIDFKTKRGHALINQIAEGFLPNRIMSRTWLQFWSANMEWEESGISEGLRKLIEMEAFWLLKTNIYLRTLDLLFRKLHRLSGQEEITLKQKEKELEAAKANHASISKELKRQEALENKNQYLINSLNEQLKDSQALIRRIINEIEDIKEGMDHILLEIDELISSIDTYTTSDSEQIVAFVSEIKKVLFEKDIAEFKKKRFINTNIRKLDDCNTETKLLLDNVDLIVAPFGKVEYATEYPHAFFIDFHYSGASEIRSIENIIADELSKFEKETFRYKDKGTPNVSSFYLLPFNKNGIERGVWILGKGSFAKSRLVKLMTIIFETLKRKYQFNLYYFPNLPSNSTVSIQAKNNNNIKFGFFYDRTLAVIKHISAQKLEDPGLFAISTTPDQMQELDADIVRDSELYFEKYDQEQLQLETISFEQVNISKFKPIRMDNNFDIGIITIVEPEKTAIDNILQNLKIESGKNTFRKYSKGYLTGEYGHTHTVVMTQQLNQGNEPVVAAYRDMVAEFKPKLMILFGVAGSISDKNKLCDVCIVNQVIDYDKRKDAADDEIEERGSTYRVGAKLLVYINEFFNKHGEFARLPACEGSLDTTFGVLPGPLGSGNAVIGNPSSKIKLWLKKFNSKTLAVETEAVGFSNTFYEEELNRVVDKIGALIIRGISDHADFDKDDEWRKMASQNAAIVLKEFIKLLPDLESLMSK